MKHIKTFESFSNEDNENIDKNAIQDEIQTKFDECTIEEKEKIKIELEKFASKNGLSFEDLKDVDKVQSVLGNIKESINENWIGDKLSQFKNWIGGFLLKVGLTGFVSTIIGSATATGIIGEVGMQNPETQSTFAFIAGTSFAISALAVIVGGSMPGKGKEMAQNIGSGSAAGRR